MKTAYHAALELIEAKENFAVAKVVGTVGSTPRKSGAWMVCRTNGEFFGTVGGGLLEHEVQKASSQVLASGKGQTFEFRLNRNAEGGLDMTCGGDATVQIDYIDAAHPENFLEEFRDVSRAVIFGCGHVGYALEPVLRHIGFQVTMADDRAEFANARRFPNAQRVVLSSFEDPYADIDIDADTYVIIATRGHAGDYSVLKNTL
ncbi:MAG: XdhC family protein, partial [Oscillospiraceae bacterium]|nr:XdhC family protein [Oscillospiraceae bacterium]